MGFFSQLRLLLWKNLLLQKRKVAVSIFEVLLPVLFAAIILTIRSVVPQNRFHNATIYDGPIPADGVDFYLHTPGGEMEVGFTPNTRLTKRLMDSVATDLAIAISSHTNGQFWC